MYLLSKLKPICVRFDFLFVCECSHISVLLNMADWKPSVLCVLFAMNSLHEVKSVSCNFELGNVCDWKNENFNVTQYQSPLENSGPERAFEGDFYIFSDSFKFGEATLELPNPETDVNCLFFAYHMWGLQMGSLRVEVKDEGQWKPVGQYKDYGSNEWHCRGISLSNPKVRMHVFKGSGPYSIIGIDDVRLFRTTAAACRTYNCTHTPEETQSVTTTTDPSTVLPGILTTEATGSDFIRENLPLLAGIPGGLVLVVFVMGLVIVFCRRNKDNDKGDDMPDQTIPNPNKPRDRYRSFPHSPPQQSEEVYDYIVEPPHGPLNNNNKDSRKISTQPAEDATDGYLNPCSVFDQGVDSYLTPLSLQDREQGKGTDTYTILPAITLPIDKVMPDSEDYLMPRELNTPNRPGKKISISDQGDVVYHDVRQYSEYTNAQLESRPYLSLSTIGRLK